ncbi:MAG: hypothetical protein PHN61_01190, partial [Methanothrix sp.]|nr:hypothetical protein [Methanothrix sp.]
HETYIWLSLFPYENNVVLAEIGVHQDLADSIETASQEMRQAKCVVLTFDCALLQKSQDSRISFDIRLNCDVLKLFCA